MAGTDKRAVFVPDQARKDPKNKKDMRELNILHIFDI